MKYPHLAARIFNTPLLVHPGKLDAIIAGLGERLLGAAVQATPAALGDVPAEMFTTRRGERSENGYRIVDGVAVIQASGALVHRSQMNMADSSYLLGYNELASKLESAVEDPDVHAVLQVFDSPGGEVAGAFEYGDRIYALRGRKPMWAIADNMAASAAYLAGSAFDQLAVGATAYAGSIGVVMRHVDMSHALAQEGVRVTHVFAGSHKVDGTPYEPLGRDVQASFQAEVDSLYAMFVEAVARNRGMAVQAIRDTQAETYRGQAAVARGLADRVATADAMLSELTALRARRLSFGPSARSTAGPTEMSKTTPVGEQTAPANTITESALEAARAEGFAQGRAAGAQAERERIQAVKAQSLQGHEKLIEGLMWDGKTTGAEAAVAVLQAEKDSRANAAKQLALDAPQPATPAATPAVEAPAAYSASGNVPAGFAVNNERQRLDAKAREYIAQHPGTDYLSAVKAVNQGA